MLDLIVEPLQYGFMQRALVVAVVATVICALLSCWLVLIGWSLMGDAVSHAVLPGVSSPTSWVRRSPWARCCSQVSPWR